MVSVDSSYNEMKMVQTPKYKSKVVVVYTFKKGKIILNLLLISKIKKQCWHGILRKHTILDMFL